ncbi:MAG: hydroxymyristoyl-ACP dehydratase [Betaproteobacteria bacterium]
MKISRRDIAALVPHAGAMSLLDAVMAWDDGHIVCHSGRHRAEDNPLRDGDRLAAVHAIEFAAQAMAAHQRLTSARVTRPQYGLLVSVRQCTFATDRLEACASPLVIEATRIAATTEALTYRFTVGPAGNVLVAGRASVLLAAADA